MARSFIATLPHPVLGQLRMPRLPVLWGDSIPHPQVRTEVSLDALNPASVGP